MKVSRRKFLKYTSWLASIPFGYLFVQSVERNIAIKGSKKIFIDPNTIESGISFQEGIIIVKENELINLFSAKCKHLGCNINKSENNQLICPCHGSKYSKEGDVLTGPASSSLEKLELKTDKDSGEFFVEV